MIINTIILSFLSAIIMTVPFSILIAKKLNDKYSILYFFTTFIVMLYFNNDMKNLLIFITYIIYSFIFIFLIKKDIKLTFLWIIILNLLTALGDHLSGFLFINIFSLNEEAIFFDFKVTVLFNISIILFVFIFSIVIKAFIKRNYKFKLKKG